VWITSYYTCTSCGADVLPFNVTFIYLFTCLVFPVVFGYIVTLLPKPLLWLKDIVILPPEVIGVCSSPFFVQLCEYDTSKSDFDIVAPLPLIVPCLYEHSLITGVL
jgi:hypothetical protein